MRSARAAQRNRKKERRRASREAAAHGKLAHVGISVVCIYGSHYYHSHVQWATFWGGWTERLHDAMCKYVFKLFVINCGACTFTKAARHSTQPAVPFDFVMCAGVKNKAIGYSSSARQWVQRAPNAGIGSCPGVSRHVLHHKPLFLRRLMLRTQRIKLRSQPDVRSWR